MPADEIIPGDWQVSFDTAWGGEGRVNFDRLYSWPDRPENGIKYYSGKATYVKKIDLVSKVIGENLKIYIDLGTVHETARVFLNNQAVGACWTSPYRVDITDWVVEGKNVLKIEVANLWSNRIIGDLNSNLGEKTYTWSNSTGHYSKDSPLKDSGLLGPVRLQFSTVFDF
jgi:hypothetical protein